MALQAFPLAPVNAKNLMEITPVNTHRYPVPPPAGSYTPAYVPVITYTGGAYGDDVDTSTANSTDAYSPKTQAAKATALGTTIVQDVGVPRGWISDDEPYGPPPVSPTDDPTVTSLAPNTAVSNTAPIWVTITGTKFTQWSQVETGNVITPYSRYMSATKMAVLMDPRSSPGVVSIRVVDHGVKSATGAGSNFTFT